jgi:hypothetical protein
MGIPLASALSINRQAAGSYVSGVWTPGARAAVTVQAHVQPELGSEVFDLVLLQRFGVETLFGRLNVYSNSVLYPVTATSEGDRFTWDGATYEITRVSNWNHLSLAHWHGKAELITSTVN